MFSASTLLKRRTDRDYINKPWNGRNEEIWTDPEDQQTSVCVQKFGRKLHPKQRQMLLVLYCCTVARYQNGNLELCNNLNNNPAPSCTIQHISRLPITFYKLNVRYHSLQLHFNIIACVDLGELVRLPNVKQKCVWTYLVCMRHKNKIWMFVVMCFGRWVTLKWRFNVMWSCTVLTLPNANTVLCWMKFAPHMLMNSRQCACLLITLPMIPRGNDIDGVWL